MEERAAMSHGHVPISAALAQDQEGQRNYHDFFERVLSSKPK